MTTYIQKSSLFPALISEPPSYDLGLTVVIPCFNEPDIIPSLEALKNCTPIPCAVEVIIVINQSETVSESIEQQNEKTLSDINVWKEGNSIEGIRFFPLFMNNLPKKSAGVGLARKIGMDEATRRLVQVGNTSAPILCYDADSLCDTNYLQAIYDHFQNHPKTQAVSIYYEHPIKGKDFSPSIYQAIIAYEIHLRYYVNVLRLAGYPNAWQTIGSSMAVRCDAYQQQGGMNKRKAGEDFYFLHKFSSIGKLSECMTTRLIPSPRASDRVPFGTGKAVNEIITENDGAYKTYHPAIFDELFPFCASIESLYEMKSEEEVMLHLSQFHLSIQQFFKAQKIGERWLEIKTHTTNKAMFIQRFYSWFNAFKVMKFTHYARDHFFPDLPIEEAAQLFIAKESIEETKSMNAEALLLYFRKKDRTQSWSFYGKNIPANGVQV